MKSIYMYLLEVEFTLNPQAKKEMELEDHDTPADSKERI